MSSREVTYASPITSNTPPLSLHDFVEKNVHKHKPFNQQSASYKYKNVKTIKSLINKLSGEQPQDLLKFLSKSRGWSLPHQVDNRYVALMSKIGKLYTAASNNSKHNLLDLVCHDNSFVELKSFGFNCSYVTYNNVRNKLTN